MKNSRRAFLQAAGIAPAAALAGVASAKQPLVAGELCRSHFAPLRGETFAFEQEVFGKVTAKLSAVEPLANAKDGERSFRLEFEAEPGQQLTQGSWRVTHAALGTVVVFVTPNDADGRLAEAIFNRV